MKRIFIPLFIFLFLCISGDYAISEVNRGLNEMYFEDGQRYFIYVPESVLENPESAYILATIHGYSGRKDNEEGINQVKYTALWWAYLAEDNNWVVLSPHFDEERFNNDYQRLNLSIPGIRADLRLNDIVQEVGELIPGINSDKIYLFGFSGGGQFVHRYAAFHPDNVLRAVAAGAGWYMWLDEELHYPVGLDTSTLPYDVKPRIKELMGLDLLILVGSDDMSDGSFRKTYSVYNLNEIQGESRRERAENWVHELERMAMEDNADFNVKFILADNTKHKISDELRRIAAKYLTDDGVAEVAELPSWDVNKDQKVNVLDLILAGRSFGQFISPSAQFNPDADGDGTVSVSDFILIGKHFGEIYFLAN
jgi:pimeloyl-ACP methyl ester carboxylesterase